jgi:hypothetical protein
MSSPGNARDKDVIEENGASGIGILVLKKALKSWPRLAGFIMGWWP